MDLISKRVRAKLLREAPERRTLDDADLDSFWDAADHRKGPLSREDIIAHLKRKNPHRWWRIQYDYKWMKKQMKKLGLDPEQARELL